MRTKITLTLGLILLTTAATAATNPPSGSMFDVVPLVSDQAGVAPNTDPNLINPWGISHSSIGPNWVSDNGTDKSTIYDRNTGAIQSLVVNIPLGAPTGTVFVTGGGFTITENGKSGSSIFLFDTESGAIEGWNNTVDANNAVVAVDNSANGSVYKGLALDSASHLFAADFANNQVEIYDSTFTKTGGFTDATLPKRFAPFNVAFLNGKVYVAFAKRERHGSDEIAGKGLGYVDVFDTSGNLLQHLIANGDLNAPWGMTIAPSGFGKFGGSLLVGNFGDGKIHAYNADTGEELGKLKDSNGKTIAIDGLWALDAGPMSNVTFSAGPDEETHGLLGLISPAGGVMASK